MSVFGRFQESKKQTRLCFAACFLLYLIGILFYTYRFPAFSFALAPTTVTSATSIQAPLIKPENTTVSALVFYGRRSRVEIMKCYIERNMVDNGGWLDEVLWVVNTDKQEDLRYLEEILATNPRYKKIYPDEIASTYSYKNIWKLLDRGKYYVKIDDDVVRYCRSKCLASLNTNYLSPRSGLRTTPFPISSHAKCRTRTTLLSRVTSSIIPP
jgi:ribosomal protein L24E